MDTAVRSAGLDGLFLSMAVRPIQDMVYALATYISWWKLDIIKMAISKDHVSCWVHKDLTITKEKMQALLTAARVLGGKEECQVRLTSIEWEYWMGTEISRIGGYIFKGK